MADAEDKLERFRAAIHAFLASTEESRLKLVKLDAEMEAVADSLSEMTPEEFGRFREEVRVQFQKATQGLHNPLSDVQVASMLDSIFERLPPKVHYSIGECALPGVTGLDFRIPRHSLPVGRKRCQRCAQPATFHTTELVRGKWTALALCERHAREHLTGDKTA